jgi:carboxypeptidase C (cathepsin A)
MIFLDQPVGVGFSYSEHGETLVSTRRSLQVWHPFLTSYQHTTEEAAVDVAAFFAILSDSFPQFQGRKLHMTGESYAVNRHPQYKFQS